MSRPIISVIIPVFNGERWLSQCLISVLNQEFEQSWEISIFDDSSTDRTAELLNSYRKKFEEKKIKWTRTTGNHRPGGVGFAKNRAVKQSNGDFLCFLDADDVMKPNRLKVQYQAAIELTELSLIGGKFKRFPEDSTIRYTKWANNLTETQLYTQIYTSHGPTLIAPTWFCSRKLYDKVGDFKEQIKGFPEDLDFFYRALNIGVKLHKVDQVIVTYTYHKNCASLSVPEENIWILRFDQFQSNVLVKWPTFSVGGGRAARRFCRFLSPENQGKVKSLCEVDPKELKRGYYQYYDSVTRTTGPRIPIVSYDNAILPIVICVKLDLTQGQLEENLAKTNWKEGSDFYYFG